MSGLKTMRYQVTGRIARITLDRPARGNGITLDMPVELVFRRIHQVGGRPNYYWKGVPRA